MARTCLVLGHRGDPRRENSLRGLEDCLAAGLDGAEIDLHLAADGSVLVFHDDDLLRLCGDRRAVATLSRSDLQRVSVFGAAIPTLPEVLARWPAGRWLNLELKAGGRELVAAVLAQVAGRRQIILSSFDPQLLAYAAELSARADDAPERALLLAPESPAWLHADAGRSWGCGSVHLDASLVTRDRVVRLQRAGLAVGCWAARNRASEAELAGFVDRVISDFVDRDNPVLVRRRSAAAQERGTVET